ncbi:MAG: VTT domain-containing protein [Patescibacteria group bacterium]|jgi:membrane protein YqaA with SNARE-associated domain
MKLFGKTIGKGEVGLVIGLGLVIVYIVVVGNLPGLRSWIADLFANAEHWSPAYAYWSAFLVAGLSNSTIIFPFPYTAYLILLGSVGFNPWALGIFAGLGAALGEITAYFTGRFGRALLNDEKKKNLAFLRELIAQKHWRVALFLFLLGCTPIPDDIFLIPLGLLKYPFWRAIWPMALGKVVLTYIFAATGSAAGTGLQDVAAGEESIWLQVASLVGVVVVLYFVSKINWDTFVHRFFGKKAEK